MNPAFALILLTPRIGPRQAFSTSSTGEGTCFGSMALTYARDQRAALVLATAFDEGNARRHTVDDVVLAGEPIVHKCIAAIAADREQHRNLAHALRYLQIRVRSIVEDVHRLQFAVAAHAIVEVKLDFNY